MCIGIVEICFGIANDIFRLFLTELSARNTSVFYFQDNNLSKSRWIFTKFDMCIYIVEICFGIAHWQISSFFDMIMAGYYCFKFYFLFLFFVTKILLESCDYFLSQYITSRNVNLKIKYLLCFSSVFMCKCISTMIMKFKIKY